jgi:hypothetical protein
MSRRSAIHASVGVLLTIAALAYLYDPPWIAGMTTGFHRWEQHAAGFPFRWTNGHASFFVPADATMLTIPMRAAFSGPEGTNAIVKVSVDDRWLADIVLDDPDAWVRTRLPLPRSPTGRRYRRVDVRVNRVRTEGNLGIQMAEVVVER